MRGESIGTRVPWSASPHARSDVNDINGSEGSSLGKHSFVYAPDVVRAIIATLRTGKWAWYSTYTRPECPATTLDKSIGLLIHAVSLDNLLAGIL